MEEYRGLNRMMGLEMALSFCEKTTKAANWLTFLHQEFNPLKSPSLFIAIFEA